MTKLSCMIKHFQVDVEKRFVKFHSRTIRICPKHLQFSCDKSEYSHAINMLFSVPFLVR